MKKILVLGASGAMGRHAVPLLVLLSTLGASVTNAETIGENVTEARPVLAKPALRGGLSFGGAELFITAFAPGWDSIPVKVDVTHPADGPRPVEIRGAKTYFKGTTEWHLQPGATIQGRIEMECVDPVVVQCVAVAVDIPSPPPFGLGDASSAEFDLPLADGRTARLSFPQPVRYHSQDSRQWGGNWTVRFAGNGGHLGHGGTRAFEKGDRIVWEMTLAAPDGLELADTKPIDIVANDDWVRLDYRKDIVAGSALDLSGQGLQDAPAGKHGWLKSVGGHFEFENLPGVEQRFYGVNLCSTANYPDHDVADRLVDRFVRLGYNTIRVHHHDGAWAAAYARRELPVAGGSGAESPSVVDDDIDKLDYLLAKCFERGIYVTTDLYVSRSVNWRDIGVDRDGEMNKHLYKTYVGIHDGAFADWCKWARAFLEHVNPYTGRAYKDEPGLPLISLINEGCVVGKDDPVVRKAWREFCASGDEGAESTSQAEAPPQDGAIYDRFNQWVNRRVWERCSAFVRSLGCRALLTNDNGGRWHGEGEGLTPLYDYVDCHSYVDHPVFLEQPWRLPFKCVNSNPVKDGKPAVFYRGWADGASKPYVLTEWNFSGPGRFRGMGGILAGALAAEHGWDGLWRFAYSHDRRGILDGGRGGSLNFDLAEDPLMAASDRAGVYLFLRGDAANEVGGDLRAPRSAAERPEVAPHLALRLDRERGSMAIITPRTCGGFAESGRIDAGPLSFEIIDSIRMQSNAVEDDSNRLLSTAIEKGTAVPTTLWASSLDGEPLERSSRILLTHLTDVQGEGARYADDSRKILLKWGKAPLVEVGAADVSLKLSTNPQCSQIANATNSIANVQVLPVASSQCPIGNCDLDNGNIGNNPAVWRVWALDTAGSRTAEIPAVFEAGTLRFRVSTNGPEGGRIYYEIVRTATAPMKFSP